MKPPLYTDFSPKVGSPEQVAEGVVRVVAPNPSPLTFTGTNTYLVGSRKLAVIDPGPDMDAHLEAVLSAVGAGRSVDRILVTHAHIDHTGLAHRLASATGAEIVAFGSHRDGGAAGPAPLMPSGEPGEGVDAGFEPDTRVRDGGIINGEGWELEAVWTPGHFWSHVCFDWKERGLLFSGDHAMSWSTSVVSPPEGDMAAYMASTAKLIRRGQRRIFPGHGGECDDGLKLLNYLLEHRKSRERQIVMALRRGKATPSEIVPKVYGPLNPRLRGAAARNVFAHLLDLESRGVVFADRRSDAAEFRLIPDEAS